jgi:hypothetical protein
MKRWRFSPEELEVGPKRKGLTKKYRFRQEEVKVVPKGNGLAKKYRFNQKDFKIVMPKERSLAKIYGFSHEKK